MYTTRLHPEIKLGVLSADIRIQLFEVCQTIVTEFYEKRREKVVYKKQLDPHGATVEALTVGSRTAYWVPEVQTIK